MIVCVVDHGQFLAVAQRLAKDCKKVYYYVPSERSFPVISEGIVGDGFDEFERIESYLNVIEECDLFVFPDIGFSAEQKDLVARGKAVWGARDGDSLESNRGLFLSTLKKVGLPVPKFEEIEGMTSLRAFLSDKTDRYIKISKWRGDFETFHWRSWKEDSIELDKIAVRFGPAQEIIKFYVFEPIDAEIEDGIDSYCIDGQFPNIVFHAVENKDKSLAGTISKWEDLPEELSMVNEKIAPVLKKYGYRGNFSTEVRITKDKESFFTDPTCRNPSPPFQLQLDLFGNYSEIIWHGANGICIDPKPTALCGVQALLKIEKSEDDWAVAVIPDEISAQVKPSFCCKIDGALVFVPSLMGNMVAWLTATGNTLEEAIENLQEYKKFLPDNVKCEDKSLADLLVEMKSAETKGIEFGVEIPEPEIVLEEKP